VISFLEKKFEKKIAGIYPKEKVDLEMINHLSGKKKTFLKLCFHSIAVAY